MRLPLRLLPIAAAAALSSACFATRNDVRVLQTDISALRSERALGDSARAQQIDRIIATMQVSSDSIRSLATQFGRFQGDAREALRGLREAITVIEELTGQSQKRLQEIRASVEAARTEAQQTADSAASPGPNQLYVLALGQFNGGSYATARSAFEDLLTRYPTADVAADAQFYVGQAYAAEKNAAAADSAFAAVVTRYPASPRAATALYRRAQLQQAAGKTAAARTLYQELRKRYPKSDEAELACSAMAGLCPRR